MFYVNLVGQHIVLGITAGVAAYKTPALVQLRAAGADVQVVMSGNAKKFVPPTALQAVSGQPVRDDLWDDQAEASMGHIELARWADQILISPTTANCVAALASSQAQLLTTICNHRSKRLRSSCNESTHVFARRHTAKFNTLKQLGYQVIDPDHGEQACGEFDGRLPDQRH